MTNHSRSILQRRLNIHPPSPHGILRLHILLLLVLAATPYAAAQSSDGTPESPYTAEDTIDPSLTSLTVIIVVLVCAFFFTGVFSIYILKCGESSAAWISNPYAGGGSRSRRLPRGLDPSVIESFPIVAYSAVKDHKIGKGALECAVCISEFNDGENLRLLPKCYHIFHPECVDTWLASHTTCPVCRYDLTLSSGELGCDSEHIDESNHSCNEQNPRSEPSGSVHQVSITIDDDQVKNLHQNVEISKGKLPRCQSTGHSLVQPGQNCERYTLRLPKEVRRQIMSQTLKRTTSCIVVLPREGSSRGGRRVGRSDRVVKSDRWVFTVTPPFFSRTGSVRSAKVCSEGSVTTGETSLDKPLHCHGAKDDGIEQSSTGTPI